jgi:galactokinase
MTIRVHCSARRRPVVLCGTRSQPARPPAARPDLRRSGRPLSRYGTLVFERIPLPASIGLAVIDSGVGHAHASGQYATRRRESFEAAAQLGVERLRDLDESALPRIGALPPVLARRARHIVTENARVLAAADALRAADAIQLGALFAASHASMRDDFETSTPDIDALVTIAQNHPDVYGARLTGGGFGGAIVLITRARPAAAASAIRDTNHAQTGRHGAVLIPPVA